MSRKIDLTGKRFGRLTVMRDTGKRLRNSVVWECKCDCGMKSEVITENLKRGSTKSCGCINSKNGKRVSKLGNEHNELVNWKENTSLQLLGDKPRKDNSSGIRGVSWSSKHKKYEAYITFQRKRHFLGNFENLEDAAKARKEAEEKYFTPILEKYGRLNESEKTEEAAPGLQS